MSKKHKGKFSGLNKNIQTKNRQELYDMDYIDKLTTEEKLLVI